MHYPFGGGEAHVDHVDVAFDVEHYAEAKGVGGRDLEEPGGGHGAGALADQAEQREEDRGDQDGARHGAEVEPHPHGAEVEGQRQGVQRVRERVHDAPRHGPFPRERQPQQKAHRHPVEPHLLREAADVVDGDEQQHQLPVPDAVPPRVAPQHRDAHLDEREDAQPQPLRGAVPGGPAGGELHAREDPLADDADDVGGDRRADEEPAAGRGGEPHLAGHPRDVDGGGVGDGQHEHRGQQLRRPHRGVHHAAVHAAGDEGGQEEAGGDARVREDGGPAHVVPQRRDVRLQADVEHVEDARL
uniref:Uncharacterized protein n=1 Tax=Setaria italica TaxID=4555 RepID=K3ZVM5_SETIT